MNAENFNMKEKQNSCTSHPIIVIAQNRSLCVQRTNKIPIHRSFSCPTKGLFIYPKWPPDDSYETKCCTIIRVVNSDCFWFLWFKSYHSWAIFGHPKMLQSIPKVLPEWSLCWAEVVLKLSQICVPNLC